VIFISIALGWLDLELELANLSTKIVYLYNQISCDDSAADAAIRVLEREIIRKQQLQMSCN